MTPRPFMSSAVSLFVTLSFGCGASTANEEGSSTGSESMATAGTAGGGSTGGNGAASNTGATGVDGDAAVIDLKDLEPFSFFVTSLAALQELSGSESGFGGDLRFGETGDGAGLRGADKICSTIAEKSMPGSSAKTWRAFLSTAAGGAGGGPVHAIERIGKGPWYDRLGRLVAKNLTDLATTRPTGADPEIVNDLPNELGVPNHNPDGSGEVDNHDILTGSNDQGKLYKDASTSCNDWTSAEGATGKPRVGHSWPRSGGGGFPGGGGNGGFPGGGGGMGDWDPENWMSSLDEAGCAPGVSLIEMGPPNANNPTVGSGGGYGGFYCFALSP